MQTNTQTQLISVQKHILQSNFCFPCLVFTAKVAKSVTVVQLIL